MVATTTSEQVGAGVSSPRRRVNLLTAVILVPLVLVIAPLFEGAVPFCDKGPWVFVLITAGFVICEPLVFHIEARNEAVSFSPTDLPLAIGLLMPSPLSLVAARIIGSAILLIGWRHQPLFKFTLNLTAFTTETLVAIAVFRAAFQPGDTASLAMWVWLIVSLMVGLVAGGVIIATAISAFEGDFAERIRKEFSYAYLFYLPGAVLGASATIPMPIEPWLLIVVLLPAPIMWLVLRSHASLMHRYTDLSHVFDFSSQVGRSAHLAEIAETAVGRSPSSSEPEPWPSWSGIRAQGRCAPFTGTRPCSTDCQPTRVRPAGACRRAPTSSSSATTATVLSPGDSERSASPRRWWRPSSATVSRSGSSWLPIGTGRRASSAPTTSPGCAR